MKRFYFQAIERQVCAEIHPIASQLHHATGGRVFYFFFFFSVHSLEYAYTSRRPDHFDYTVAGMFCSI